MEMEIDTKPYITDLRLWLIPSKRGHYRQKLAPVAHFIQYICRKSS